MRRASLAGLLFVCLAGTLLAGCQAQEESAARPTRTAEAVLADHCDSLLAISGVKGTCVTDWREEEVIVVIVEDRTSPALARIPERLEGHRVVVLDEEQTRRLGGL